MSALRRGLVRFLTSAVVAALALGTTLVVIALAGYSVPNVARALWDGAVGDPSAIAATLQTSLPLTLVALGWIVAFSARRINIGFDGQILIGGMLAAVVGLHVSARPSALHLALAVVAGVVGGALWASIPAVLFFYRGVNELISTFLLNFVAIFIINWIVRGPLQEPSHSLAQSSRIPDSAAWPRFGATLLSWDIFYIPVAVTATILILRYTTIGFRLRIVSANEDMAAYAGLAPAKIGALALITSGALAGLAGSSLILASPVRTLQDNFSSNFGFDGIAAALLASNTPGGALLAALFLGALRQGSGLVEARVGVPASLVAVNQGVIILLMSALVLRRSGWSRLGRHLGARSQAATPPD
jgi:ABC-type uncharacterized transport system permease subunit